MLIRSVITLSLFSLAIGCGVKDTNDLAGEDKPQASQNQQYVFAKGASNTQGFGLKVGLEDRINFHLIKENSDVNSALAETHKSVLFTLDYFFPTNFMEISDKKISFDDLQRIAIMRVKEMQASYSYVIVADLMDASEMSEESRMLLNEARNAPFKNINTVLNDNGYNRHATTAINQALRKYARTQPNNFILVRFNDAIEPILRDGYKDNSARDLFQEDRLHLNYKGQSALFNVFAMKPLSIASGVTVKEMSVDALFDTEWEKTVARTIGDAVGEKRGSAVFVDAKQLTGVDPYVKGTANKGIMTNQNDLKAIAGVIKKTIASQSGSMPIAKRLGIKRLGEDRRPIYSLDLTNTLAYTKIDLLQDKINPRKFVGAGSDYWGASLGVNRLWSPAFTNYYFILTETGENTAHIRWVTFPQLVNGKNVQVIPTKRLAELDDKDGTWWKEINHNAEEYNRLEFNFDIKMDW